MTLMISWSKICLVFCSCRKQFLYPNLPASKKSTGSQVRCCFLPIPEP